MSNFRCWRCSQCKVLPLLNVTSTNSDRFLMRKLELTNWSFQAGNTNCPKIKLSQFCKNTFKIKNIFSPLYEVKNNIKKLATCPCSWMLVLKEFKIPFWKLFYQSLNNVQYFRHLKKSEQRQQYNLTLTSFSHT